MCWLKASAQTTLGLSQYVLAILFLFIQLVCILGPLHLLFILPQMLFSRLFSGWLPLVTFQLKCHLLRKGSCEDEPIFSSNSLKHFSKAMKNYHITFGLSLISSSFHSVIILFMYLLTYLLTFFLRSENFCFVHCYVTGTYDNS